MGGVEVWRQDLWAQVGDLPDEEVGNPTASIWPWLIQRRLVPWDLWCRPLVLYTGLFCLWSLWEDQQGFYCIGEVGQLKLQPFPVLGFQPLGHCWHFGLALREVQARVVEGDVPDVRQDFLLQGRPRAHSMCLFNGSQCTLPQLTILVRRWNQKGASLPIDARP